MNIWNDRSKDMGYSGRQTEEVLHADLFNNGFTNTGYDTPSGGTAVSFFSASHPLIRGGGAAGQLQSNVLASPSTLSVTSYRDMLTLARLLFDETGVRRIQLDMKMLVVPPQLEFVGEEITKSAGRPDTANRVDNVTRGKTSCEVWDYLLNAKYWFMGAEKSQHKVKSYQRERFAVRSDYDWRTRTNWVGCAEAFSFGYSDYKGWFGTNPV
jgi:phage major head subunit gpT-like protein